MSFSPTNIENWSLGDTEIAKYAPNAGSSNAPSLLLYIPKLMPKIAFGVPKVTPVPLNKAILINDDACKPAISATISSQNYKTVPRANNRKFARVNFTHGAEIQVSCTEGDPDTLTISTKVDNSIGSVVTETYAASTYGGKGTVTLKAVPFYDRTEDITIDLADMRFSGSHTDQNTNPI